MVLDRGIQVHPRLIIDRLWEGSIRRLQIWAGIGADVDNGIWAMYGVRAGLSMMMDYPAADFSKIANYEWFIQMFDDHVRRVHARVDHSDIHADIPYDPRSMDMEFSILESRIQDRSGIELTQLTPHQSKIMKGLIEQPDRGVDYMVEE